MFRQIATVLRRIHVARARTAPARQRIAIDSPALEATRRAVATAMVRNSVEIDRCRHLRNRIADYERLFDQALEIGNVEMARESATELAKLEGERAICEKAQRALHAEIDRLKRELLTANAAEGKKAAAGGEAMA